MNIINCDKFMIEILLDKIFVQLLDLQRKIEAFCRCNAKFLLIILIILLFLILFNLI